MMSDINEVFLDPLSECPDAKLVGRMQANLEQFERVGGKLKVIRNGHIDIKP